MVILLLPLDPAFVVCLAPNAARLLALSFVLGVFQPSKDGAVKVLATAKIAKVKSNRFIFILPL
jgi:hypothetical protein